MPSINHVFAGVFLGLLLSLTIHDAMAQDFGGRRGRTNTPPQEQDPQEQEQQVPQGSPFIDGIIVGIGINTFLGDMDSNPNDNILKHVAGANLTAMVGADMRFGIFDQYSVAAHLTYERLAGQNIIDLTFTNNVLNLDVQAEYAPPIVQQNLFRFFIGGGPSLLISPSYDFGSIGPNTNNRDNWREDLGTRVVGNFVAGVTLLDRVRIGMRVFTTDFVDGHSGRTGDGPVDMLGFFSVSHRFDLRY